MSKVTIEQIKEELDVQFVLDRESVAYKETRGVNGVQLNVRECPECGDDRWRTYFGVDTGFGNCFVCSKSFNVLTFVKALFRHEEWRDVFRTCEELLSEQGWRPAREAHVAVTQGAVKLPVSLPLPLEDGSNLSYLEGRGFGADICRYFKLAWCQAGWWMFTDPDTGQTATQDFSDRVLIPVYDLDGELKVFQGRDLTGNSKMKYLFPKTLPGTGRYLLNAQNVIATDHVVMGEGAFDIAAIKLALDRESDLRHVVPVGSFGKHLSYGSANGDDQLGRFNQLRKRGVKTVTIMWDGGESELVAALNAARILTGVGLVVRIALLPDGKDPNEIPASLAIEAFRKAQIWSPKVDITWRLRNPYAKQRVA